MGAHWVAKQAQLSRAASEIERAADAEVHDNHDRRMSEGDGGYDAVAAEVSRAGGWVKTDSTVAAVHEGTRRYGPAGGRIFAAGSVHALRRNGITEP